MENKRLNAEIDRLRQTLDQSKMEKSREIEMAKHRAISDTHMEIDSI